MLNRMIPTALLALAVTVPVTVSRALAQDPPKLEMPQASPSASWKQKVGVTDVELEYSRPSMKGRKIFGGLVPYGEVWRTGANSATKITFGADVKLEGTLVPAGVYQLATIPGEGEWTVIVNKNAGEWGTYSYDAKNDVARIKVKPQTLAASVETFTIEIGDLSATGATLAIVWDKTRVPVKLEVDTVAMLKPKIEAVMASSAKEKPYLQAAMFYFENGLDLKQAKTWVEEAEKAQPDAPWVVYRKGLILQKLGDKAGANAAAQKTIELAGKKGGELGAEYKRLGEALLAATK